MDQKKIGQFIKELRKEKGITQEQLAEKLKVSGRTVSRWETGSNMPDISLLVEIADFFDVDVRELIEGERKSEMMDEELKEIATKMADYADAEKGKLLKRIQIISFVGVIISILSIGWQSFVSSSKDTYEFRLSMLISFIILVIMAVITLYVTGLLEKIVKNKRLLLGVKIVTIASLIIAAWRVIIITIFAGILIWMVNDAEIEVYEDVSKYNEYMNFSNGAYEPGVDTIWTKCGMDETIWPAEITDSMNVADFKMVYYNPWDEQYLGYLVVDYTSEGYEKEVERLHNYESTEYIGYYDVKEEKTYDLLAVNADSYNGFVYALTDGKGRIIYAEQIFCNNFMDLDYNEYIPQEYLLDGFNATMESGYYKQIHSNDIQ